MPTNRLDANRRRPARFAALRPFLPRPLPFPASCNEAERVSMERQRVSNFRAAIQAIGAKRRGRDLTTVTAPFRALSASATWPTIGHRVRPGGYSRRSRHGKTKGQQCLADQSWQSMGNDVYIWLARVGLDQYAALFSDNEIDLEVLPDLTQEDLEKLGIPLGHRKKLLRAIRTLTAGEPASVTPSTNGATPVVPCPPSSKPERRQLTVMMCDLVDSTGLSQRFDPEDLSLIYKGYRNCCDEVIRRFHGTIARYMGDGIFAYFGYPQADEADAERAIRAGLRIVREVEQIKPLDVALQTRVGIATGVVVAGEIIGEGFSQEHAVSGETPNLTARLTALADPGTVVIADGTRRLATHLFEYVDLGRHTLKGFGDPVQAWRVVSESTVKSRSEALHVTAELTPLVGREEEVELLERRWRHAQAGDGQVVLLSGEPGVGKSRLAQTLADRLANEPHGLLHFYCSPYYQNTALYPVTEQLSRAARFAPNDSNDQKLEKVEVMLARTVENVGEIAPLFAHLLSIPAADRYPPVNLTPQGRKQKALDALEEQLIAVSDDRPALIIFEDLHWSDPTTRELLDRIVDRIPALPVLMLLIGRPEFIAPWSSLHYVTTLILKRLSPKNCTEIVDHLTGNKPLPPEVMSQIIDKTDGIPLFVEEVFKAVVEAGIVSDEGNRYALKGPSRSLAVPSTLAGSLMARLDRLGSVKEVAQVAAAVGRQFSYAMLAGVSRLTDTALGGALDQLAASDIIYRRGTEPHTTYTFKHALLQDAAYSSLLHSESQQLHTRIARLLEEEYPERVENEPELVAHHYTSAALTEQAIDYWRKAGERAIQRSANAEAIDHLAKGLELLETLPESLQRAQTELQLQTCLGPALTATRGYAAHDVEAAYIRARELSKSVGDTSKVFSVLRGLWVYYFIRADLHEAHELGKQLLDLAQRERHPGYLLEAHRAIGQILLYRGEFVESRLHLEEGIALYDPDEHRSHIYLYGNDPGIACSSYQAYVLWFLGYPDQALRQSEKALSLARELAHPFSLTFALAFAAYLHQHLRDVEATRALADETVAISREQGFPFWANQERILRGWAQAEQGAVEDGTTELRTGLDAYRAMGSGLGCPWFLGLLAEVYAKSGRASEGLRALEDCFTTIEKTGERFYLAEMHRLRGELIASLRGVDAAAEVDACYDRSKEIAHEQSAKSWELRAVVSQARFWRDLGRPRAARDLLLPVYERFTEGLDTTELTQARRLLDELGHG